MYIVKKKALNAPVPIIGQ